MKEQTPKHPVVVAACLLGVSLSAAAGEDIFARTLPDGSVELSNVPVEQDFVLLMAGPASSRRPSQRANPTDTLYSLSLRERVAQYRELVAEAARRSEVDARLLHAVISVESGYNPLAVSPKGAVGLMQLMPDTARRYGISDMRDPTQNILAGASYLRDLLKMFNNDVSLALAAYNAGENAVIRNGSRIPPNRETTAYVPKVLAVYRKLEDLVI